MGFILLEGGSEFSGAMADPDRQAIRLAGGNDILISIIPAAAAPDGNHLKAGDTGLKWFKQLGACRVRLVPLVDRDSADLPDVVSILASSKLIFMLGGFPGHLAFSLSGSRAWQACLEAYSKGAVIAGSSAGAMVLCSDFYDPQKKKISKGLNLVPGACILPHHNRFGAQWATNLKRMLPDSLLIGIDEETGLLGDGSSNGWRVYGDGAVTRYCRDTKQRFAAGETVSI